MKVLSQDVNSWKQGVVNNCEKEPNLSFPN
jgi:hypothetical protein